MTDDEPSLNIPSLLTLAVVSYFVFRWFFNRDDNPSAGGRGRGRGNAVDPASVAQIAQMFPQMSSRDIMWDLQRNGGSVAATTERILTGRGLETVCIPLMLSLMPRISPLVLSISLSWASKATFTPII
jgi:coupling of ubiquitin conjugation to ER degradation protein 1